MVVKNCAEKKVSHNWTRRPQKRSARKNVAAQSLFAGF